MAFMFLWDNDFLTQEGTPSKLTRDKWQPENSESVKERLAEGRPASDIMLVHCPHCHSYSYYNQGFTEWCEWCGKLAVSPDSEDETLTLEDYYYAGWEYDETNCPDNGYDADEDEKEQPNA